MKAPWTRSATGAIIATSRRSSTTTPGRSCGVPRVANAATLPRFFDQLGERQASIKAISIDMSGGYQQAIRESVPETKIAFDLFHVVRVRHEALPVRAGCETPAPGCRGSPVKLRAV